MTGKPYRPSIRSLQLDFARRLAHKRMLEQRERAGTRPPKSGITDNSEPWLENPDSVGDFIEISQLVKQSEDLWLSRFKTSSTA
jgi:hypothetical protein